MKKLNKLVLKDYVELTDQQKKKILGGINTAPDTCKKGLDGACSGNCPDKFVWDNKTYSGSYVKQTCKALFLYSEFLGCGCQ